MILVLLCFISSGTIFQIFGSKYEMVSFPFGIVFTDGCWNQKPPLIVNIWKREKFWYYSRCNIVYNLLCIMIVSAWIFFGALSQYYLFQIVLGNYLNDHNILTLAVFHVCCSFFVYWFVVIYPYEGRVIKLRWKVRIENAFSFYLHPCTGKL